MVVTLGHAATVMQEAIARESFTKMTIEFVWCEASWKRGHASNIMAARSMFEADQPLLIVMSDHVFTFSLLRTLVDVDVGDDAGAVTLIDDTPETLEWASKDHCSAFCKNGCHVQVLVKVLKTTDGKIARIGKRLKHYDALEAGAYVATSALFDVLTTMLKDAAYCTLADAMQVLGISPGPRPPAPAHPPDRGGRHHPPLPPTPTPPPIQVLAEQGRLRYASTGGNSWYGELTVASLNRDALPSKAVKNEWREEVAALLRTTSPRMAPALPHSSSYNMPLYELGTAIGVGSTSVVVEAQAPRKEADKGFAVKVVRRGQGVTPTTDVEREIMWEVRTDGTRLEPRDGAHGRLRHSRSPHPLPPPGARLAAAAPPAHRPRDGRHRFGRRHLHRHGASRRPRGARHHTRRTRTLAQRGRSLTGASSPMPHAPLPPQLTDYIEMHETCREANASHDDIHGGSSVVPLACCQRFFAQLVAALCHAHGRGFVHCDIKPQNVRLDKTCTRAVLTDWGFARQAGDQKSPITHGTPAFASPEQLTGYNCDGISSGRRRLCGGADVWALGATLYTMVVGRPPFGGETFEDLVRNVLALNYEGSLSSLPPQPRDLVEMMLQVAAYDRASLKELKAHDWVVGGMASDADGLILECEPCDDDDDEEEGGGKGKKGKSNVRQLGLMVLYGSLCALALLSHLRSPAEDAKSVASRRRRRRRRRGTGGSGVWGATPGWSMPTFF